MKWCGYKRVKSYFRFFRNVLHKKIVIFIRIHPLPEVMTELNNIFLYPNNILTWSCSLLKIIRRIPYIRLKRRHAPCGPCLIASLVRLAVDPGGLELSADRRPLFIDRAKYIIADLAFKGNTSWGDCICSDHYPAEIIKLFCKVHRHTPCGCIIWLWPVKWCLVKRTARTTTQTWIGPAHKFFLWRIPSDADQWFRWKPATHSEWFQSLLKFT